MLEIDLNVAPSLCSVKLHEQHTDTEMGHVSFIPAHPPVEQTDLSAQCNGHHTDNHTLLKKNGMSSDTISIKVLQLCTKF